MGPDRANVSIKRLGNANLGSIFEVNRWLRAVLTTGPSSDLILRVLNRGLTKRKLLLRIKALPSPSRVGLVGEVRRLLAVGELGQLGLLSSLSETIVIAVVLHLFLSI